ncbi:MAG: SDR family NAD(P)-dependent oxidoreductase [Flavobacteriales bacterium]|nr:SDR family NAD(P)-dependent oxidoreductase [Flavobacteriales bacterium]
MLRKLQKNSRTALITGGSSGIGLCYAHRLASLGYKLVIVSNQEDKIVPVAHELAYKYDVDVMPFYLDLAKKNSAEELFAYCKEKKVYVDVLINNAGVFFFNEIIDTSVQRIELMLNLHVLTTTKLCKYFAEDMKERKCRGFILNMSSLSAWTTVPGITMYEATKAYIKSFSKSLHHELKPYGIGVTVVCPGGVATGLYSLSSSYQKLGVCLGVLMKPQTLANRAVRAMFARRECVVPGLLNKIAIPVLGITPGWALRWVKKKVSKYEH